MEDAHTTLLKLGDTDFSFFGVFDGHGGKFKKKRKTPKKIIIFISCLGM